MKIGILTLPLHTNYGGILQAYALQTVLERMGHEVEVFIKPQAIDPPLFRKRIVMYLRQIARRILGRSKRPILLRNQNKEIKIEQKYTRKFIEKYIRYKTISSLDECKEYQYDAIIVGSDQVWRPCYFRGFWKKDMGYAFLEFCHEKVKRIAFSPSFGINKWEFTEKETIKCRKLIQKFCAISVREVSGCSLIKEHLNYNDVQLMIDPTLMISKKEYIDLIKEYSNKDVEGQLMYYILDDNKEKQTIAQIISSKCKLQMFRANSNVESNTAPISKRIQPPLESWLNGFDKAAFIVTDSFHACVFSIIFNKPFIAIGNSFRGIERIESLLAHYNLSNCLIKTDSWNENFELPNFNWNTINELISKDRLKAKEFIEKSLNI